VNKNASAFIGDIPKNYDEGLGPVIFQPYAEDIARRAAAAKPLRVLELAAGTGIVSRALKDAIGPEAHLTVTDLNPPMLDVARAKFRENETVSFAPADAMQLNFPDAHFDMVVCQFGVMFFPDKVRSFRQACRVLRPGGEYLLSVWGTLDENPFSKMTHAIVAELFPDNPPGFYKVPFSYADPDIVVADLKAAQFNDVEVEAVAVNSIVNDWSAFARGLIYGNPIIAEINALGGITPDEVVNTIEERFQNLWGAPPAAMPRKATVFRARKAEA